MKLYQIVLLVTALLATAVPVMAFGPLYNTTNSTNPSTLSGYNATSYNLTNSSTQTPLIGPIYNSSINSTSPSTLGTLANFVLFNTSTLQVTSTIGGTLHSRSPNGYNMTLVVMPGTYANVSNTITSTYNVTLSTFRAQNLGTPANLTGYTFKSAFLIQINHRTIQAVAFVNSTGVSKSVTFTVNHLSNWTSFSYLNEVVNGTGFVGGFYGKQNIWVYNKTAGTMSDVSLDKAQMHVYLASIAPLSAPIVNVTTTVAPVTTVAAVTTAAIVNTTNSTTYSAAGSSTTLWIVGVVIVIIIIAIVAWLMMRKK